MSHTFADLKISLFQSEEKKIQKKIKQTLRFSAMPVIVSVRHSFADPTTRISPTCMSRHHSGSAIPGSLYRSRELWPRKVRYHLSLSAVLTMSLDLFFSFDAFIEKEVQGVRSRRAQIEEERMRGVMEGCGWETWERIPRARLAPDLKLVLALGFYQWP